MRILAKELAKQLTNLELEAVVGTLRSLADQHCEDARKCHEAGFLNSAKYIEKRHEAITYLLAEIEKR